jgi:Protein of unknown function (DUF4238)
VGQHSSPACSTHARDSDFQLARSTKTPAPIAATCLRLGRLLTGTNDHTVPQMYLRRFAERRGSRYFISARPTDNITRAVRTNVRNVSAVNGFYWGTTPEDVPHHEAEALLQQIESGAAPVLSAILDDPQYALPQQWPLERPAREVLSWFIAAQLLRTTRQRKRLAHLADQNALTPHLSLRSTVEANRHLAYMAQLIGALAFVINERPWGLAFSDACLPTSDVPAVVLNGHDADDQLMSIAVWDVLLPLDPHRMLFLPNIQDRTDDPRKRNDHRFKLDGGLGLAFTTIIQDAADAFVFHHPMHDPFAVHRSASPGLPRPWSGDQRTDQPEYYVSYSVLNPALTIEREWLSKHPPPKTT